MNPLPWSKSQLASRRAWPVHAFCDLFASSIPSPHQPSPSPRPKRARPSIQRLHNTISDLIGLITICPVCAEHTLPLASPFNTKAALPRARRNDPSPVSTRPTPFEKPLTSHSRPTTLNRLSNISESKAQSLVPPASCPPFFSNLVELKPFAARNSNLKTRTTTTSDATCRTHTHRHRCPT